MNLNPYKIIVVEDEVRMCRLINTSLLALSDDNWIVYPLNSAQDALDILNKETVDVLVSDLNLPGISGLELLKRARSIQEDLQMIVITGHGDMDNAIEALQVGANNYFKKPLPMEQLYLSVKESISKRALLHKLKESEERFRTAFLHAAAGMIILRTDGKILQVNNSICKMLGFSESDLLKKSFSDLVHSDLNSNTSEIIRELVAGTTDHSNFENKFICKDDTFIWANISMSVVTDSEEPVYLTVQVVDTTEIHNYRETLEKEVHERTQELNAALKDAENTRDHIDGILKSMADGLIVTDLNNEVTNLNPAAEELLSIKYQDVIHRPFDFVPMETSAVQSNDQATMPAAENEFDFAVKLPYQSVPVILRARTSIIRDKEGNITSKITNFHDVSRDREVARMKNEFLSTAAHELRSPLTSIQGFSEILLLKKDLSAEQRKRFLNHINNQASKLSAIISDLLDISRIESGTSFTLNKNLHKFADILDEVILPYRVQSKKHKFKMDISDGYRELLIDSEKIGQVLKNLVSNSVKYSPGGGIITLSTKMKKDQFIFSIKDEGLGMTSDELSRIFEKFYRADASSTAIEGTGLGMNISKYLVEAHGGTINVESEYGAGTTVTFCLPINEVN